MLLTHADDLLCLQLHTVQSPHTVHASDVCCCLVVPTAAHSTVSIILHSIPQLLSKIILIILDMWSIGLYTLALGVNFHPCHDDHRLDPTLTFWADIASLNDVCRVC